MKCLNWKNAVLLIMIAAMLMSMLAGCTSNQTDPTDGTEPSETSGATTDATTDTVPSAGNPDDVTCKGSYTVTDDQIAATRDTVVATVGDNQLTNGQLQLNYWYTFYNFVYTYSSLGYLDYMGLDQTQPLDTQLSIDGETTWQQFMLKDALNNWNTYVALSSEAKANGYELNDEQKAYLETQTNADNLLLSAQNGGYASIEEMLANDMGAGITLEEYVAFMELFYTSAQYLTSVTESITLTADEIEAYFDENADGYSSSGIEKNDEERCADVRHILIPVAPTTDAETGEVVYTQEAWDECLKAAQAVLDEYRAGETTEERFAELVGIYSEDGGSNTTGGLYQDFQVGTMVEPFETWSFDESRQYGDTDLVKTDYGYHVMFFVECEPIWYAAAETDLLSQKSMEYLDEIQAKYPIEVDYEAIAIGVAGLMKAEETAE